MSKDKGNLPHKNKRYQQPNLYYSKKQSEIAYNNNANNKRVALARIQEQELEGWNIIHNQDDDECKELVMATGAGLANSCHHQSRSQENLSALGLQRRSSGPWEVTPDIISEGHTADQQTNMLRNLSNRLQAYQAMEKKRKQVQVLKEMHNSYSFVFAAKNQKQMSLLVTDVPKANNEIVRPKATRNEPKAQVNKTGSENCETLEQRRNKVSAFKKYRDIVKVYKQQENGREGNRPGTTKNDLIENSRYRNFMEGNNKSFKFALQSQQKQEANQQQQGVPVSQRRNSGLSLSQHSQKTLKLLSQKDIVFEKPREEENRDNSRGNSYINKDCSFTLYLKNLIHRRKEAKTSQTKHSETNQKDMTVTKINPVDRVTQDIRKKSEGQSQHQPTHMFEKDAVIARQANNNTSDLNMMRPTKSETKFKCLKNSNPQNVQLKMLQKNGMKGSGSSQGNLKLVRLMELKDRKLREKRTLLQLLTGGMSNATCKTSAAESSRPEQQNTSRTANIIAAKQNPKQERLTQAAVERPLPVPKQQSHSLISQPRKPSAQATYITIKNKRAVVQSQHYIATHQYSIGNRQNDSQMNKRSIKQTAAFFTGLENQFVSPTTVCFPLGNDSILSPINSSNARRQPNFDPTENIKLKVRERSGDCSYIQQQGQRKPDTNRQVYRNRPNREKNSQDTNRQICIKSQFQDDKLFRHI